jgi:hypothetical protein
MVCWALKWIVLDWLDPRLLVYGLALVVVVGMEGGGGGVVYDTSFYCIVTGWVLR